MTNPRKVERNGKTFTVSGSFGNVHVYLGKQCLVFGLMTHNDADNWIWRNY